MTKTMNKTAAAKGGEPVKADEQAVQQASIEVPAKVEDQTGSSAPGAPIDSHGLPPAAEKMPETSGANPDVPEDERLPLQPTAEQMRQVIEDLTPESRQQLKAELELIELRTTTTPVQTVPMIRAEEDANGGPTAADVHPDEVENYKTGGWQVA